MGINKIKNTNKILMSQKNTIFRVQFAQRSVTVIQTLNQGSEARVVLEIVQ